MGGLQQKKQKFDPGFFPPCASYRDKLVTVLENIYTNEFLRRLCLNDSQEAFHSLYVHYYPRLKLFLDLFLKTDRYSDDIIADIFMKIWDRRKLLLPIRNFDAYIFRIARNQAVSFLRREMPVSLEEMDAAEKFADSEDISSNLENRDLFSRIEEAVQSLPPRTRQVFEMVRLNKLKYKEVASILGISEKTVEWHMTGAIHAIRETVKNEKTR